MNITLKRELDVAYEYFEYEQAQFISKIEENQNAIKNFKAAFNRRHPPQTPKAEMAGRAASDIVMCLLLWPVGLMNLRKNKKNKEQLELQANQRFVEEMKAYEEFCEEVTRNIRHALTNIEVLEEKHREYENANKTCLNFLPHAYRSHWWVGEIRCYVTNGRADTLKEAVNMIHEDLKWQEEQEAKIAMFEKDLADRQRIHSETLASLNEIKKKQDEAANQRQRLQRTISDIYYEIR